MNKVYASLAIIFVFFLSCQEDSSVDGTKNGFGTLNFAPKPQSSQGTSFRISSSSLDSAKFLWLSIESNGETILENEQLELFRLGEDNLISAPVVLNVGEYQLTSFHVLDANLAIIYSSPLEGSELASIVSNPLPISFEVTEDDFVKLVPEVISTDGSSASSFGYTTLDFDIIETTDFLISIVGYDTTIDNFKQLPFDLEIETKEGEGILDSSYDDSIHSIRILSSNDSIRLKVSSEGYLSQQILFSIDSIASHDEKPLSITMDLFSSFTRTFSVNELLRGVGAKIDQQGDILFTAPISGGESVGGFTFPGGGVSSYLVKYSSSGELNWVRPMLSPTGFVFSSSIAIDLFDNVYCGGVFQGGLSTDGLSLTDTQAGREDAFIAKYDSDGNVIWLRKPIAAEPDFIQGLAVDSQNSLLATGFFISEATFGDTVISDLGNVTMFTWKLDQNGTHQWVTSFESDNNILSSRGRALTSDIDNDVYIGGFTDGENIFFGGDKIGLDQGKDPFLVKVDDLGNPIWGRSMDNVDQSFGIDNQFVSIAYHQGDIYGIGDFETSLTAESTTLNGIGDNDLFLASYSLEGGLNWFKVLGSVDEDRAGSVSVSDDRLFALFTFNDNISLDNGMLLTSDGGNDACLLEMTLDGNIVRAIQIGGTGNVLGTSIDTDDDKVLISGTFNGELIIDGETFDSGTGDNAYIHVFSR